MTTMRTVGPLFIQVNVNVDAVRCPKCGSEANQFDCPVLGQPWRLCCSSGHEYSLEVKPEALS